jgi:hypothetical protein
LPVLQPAPSAPRTSQVGVAVPSTFVSFRHVPVRHDPLSSAQPAKQQEAPLVAEQPTATQAYPEAHDALAVQGSVHTPGCPVSPTKQVPVTHWELSEHCSPRRRCAETPMQYAQSQ